MGSKRRGRRGDPRRDRSTPTDRGEFDPERYARAEQRGDGRWIVRSIPGARATKEYRCPGCHQAIRPGTPHLVAWPGDPGWLSETGLEDRRHWHTACWQRRR